MEGSAALLGAGSRRRRHESSRGMMLLHYDGGSDQSYLPGFSKLLRHFPCLGVACMEETRWYARVEVLPRTRVATGEAVTGQSTDQHSKLLCVEQGDSSSCL